LITHPSGLGVNCSVFIERFQFQYLAIQSSYDIPNGLSSLENNSTPYALYSPENAKKVEKTKNNVMTIEVDLLYLLIINGIIEE
jgi:hypothetical protein